MEDFERMRDKSHLCRARSYSIRITRIIEEKQIEEYDHFRVPSSGLNGGFHDMVAIK